MNMCSQAEVYLEVVPVLTAGRGHDVNVFCFVFYITDLADKELLFNQVALIHVLVTFKNTMLKCDLATAVGEQQ